MTEDLEALLEEDPARVLALIQQKIRQGEDPSDDEMRLCILAARAGRLSASIATKAKRAAPKAAPSIFDLFQRKET